MKLNGPERMNFRLRRLRFVEDGLQVKWMSEEDRINPGKIIKNPPKSLGTP
jgi:hypothetical protein